MGGGGVKLWRSKSCRVSLAGGCGGPSSDARVLDAQAGWDRWLGFCRAAPLAVVPDKCTRAVWQAEHARKDLNQGSRSRSMYFREVFEKRLTSTRTLACKCVPNMPPWHVTVTIRGSAVAGRHERLGQMASPIPPYPLTSHRFNTISQTVRGSHFRRDGRPRVRVVTPSRF